MDTRICKFCGIEFNNFQQGQYIGIDIDGTFNEGYCNKLHRKAHEKQLIKEGKLEPVQSLGFGILKDARLRDKNGELIHFPKDERPYYDRALQRTFHSKKEKAEYMRKNNLVMDGSDDKHTKALEAGDNRYASRKVR